jgi:hypothetical protein
MTKIKKSMFTPTTPDNDHEIKSSMSVLHAVEFKQRLSSEYGIDGVNPAQRVQQLKLLSVEGIAILLEDINQSIQGSAHSLMSHDKAVKVGGKSTIQPEDRYGVFSRLVQDIRNCPDDISPERVGDVLNSLHISHPPQTDTNTGQVHNCLKHTALPFVAVA